MALAVLPPRPFWHWRAGTQPLVLCPLTLPCVVPVAGPVGTLHILIDLDLDVSLCKIEVVETHLSECFLRP